MTAVPVNPLTIKKGCGCFSFWYLNWGRPFKKGKERVCVCNAASSKTHPAVVKRRLCVRCRRPFVLTYGLSPIAVLTFYRAALQLHLIAGRCTLQHWSTEALEHCSTGALQLQLITARCTRQCSTLCSNKQKHNGIYGCSAAECATVHLSR